MTTTPQPVTAGLLRSWALDEQSGSKRGRGQVVVIGGDETTPGACLLAGLAALRAGAGVLSMVVPAAVAPALAVAVPESSVLGWHEDSGGAMTDESRDRLAGYLGRATAVLVGPGLTTPERTRMVLQAVAGADDASDTVAYDAFALGVLAQDRSLMAASRRVLTPNDAEAAHLLDREIVDDEDDEDVAREIARTYDATVSYSGVVVGPRDRLFTVEAGHSGLGTSGSGDVLTGVLVGLLARGADLDQAACWATYLHKAAGDRLAARIGRLGFLARELLDEVPLVMSELRA
ncbi:MAG: NAD(P)H-hydrate dehydratase [Jatrophihabitans sp.]|uniref:NAD(P)H-hydrate dehydratase n=1 Tax=Jatrophihabitans sp. TaxID=1932789 RepID=UPI003F7CDFF6